MGMVLFMLISAPVFSQDIHFSQFQSSPLNLNPARTGLFDGDIRFVGNYRNQWKSVSEPYRTFSFSGDMKLNSISGPLNGFGTGLVVFHDKAGDSELSTLNIALSFSWTRMLDGADGRHAITLGTQIGFYNRSINFSKLTFDEQFNGDIFDPNYANTESFDGDNHSYPDLSLGAVYTFKISDNTYLGAGAGLQHLNRPDDSFFGESVKVPVRLQADIKLDAKLSEKIDIIPTLLYQDQSSFNELVAGASLRFHLNNKPGKLYNFYAGGFVRTKDAIILSAGLDYNYLNVGFSYDINTSDLDRASDGKGGPEISLIYIIKKVKPLNTKPPCPVY